MRILNIIPKFPINPNKTVVGGSASALFNLSKALVKEGVNIEILSHYPLVSAQDLEKIANNTGINFSTLNMRSPGVSKKYGAEFTLRLLFKSIKTHNDFDIIHGHSGHIDYLLPVKLFSTFKRKPLVYSLYCPLNLESSIVRYPMRESLIKQLLKDVKLIVISKNIHDSVSSFIPSKSIAIIPPSIDIDKFSPAIDKQSLRQKYAYPPDQPILLFVGNFSKNKNLECALLATAKVKQEHPKIKLIITTELSHNKYSDREAFLKNMIVELDLSENVEFFGILDNMAEVMKVSDVLVAPFIDSDGPSDYFIPALEAMSVGTPVIVSDRGGMKEVVNQENGILLPPDQPDLWAKNILQLLNDKAYQDFLASNAIKYINRQFHPHIVAKQTISFYKEINKDEVR
jgi:glycosyltransferase involved in cell wall biosynthesis